MILIAKTFLKKQLVPIGEINEDNYEDFFIAYSENDLNNEQKADLDEFMAANQHLKKEYELHLKLKLIPDNTIVYQDKNKLKHSTRIIPFWYSSSAAAVLLIIASVWFFRSQQNEIIRDRNLFITEIANSRINIHDVSVRSYDYKITDRVIAEIPETVVNYKEEPQNTYFASRMEPRNSNAKFVYYEDYKRIATRNVTNHSTAIKPDIEKEKTVLASILNKHWNKLTSGININNSKKEKTNDPTYVKVLDTGIKVFNTITGSQTYTSKSYNQEGDLTGYQIEGRELLMSRNIHSGSTE